MTDCEPDYRALVEQSLFVCKDYIDELQEKFYTRDKYRRQREIPVLAFCGHGRSGKDESAKMLSEEFPQIYCLGSVSRFVLPLIAAARKETLEHCWETRHQHRMFWKEFCDTVRAKDPTILVRWVLSSADVVVGIRASPELWVSWGRGLLDHLIWVSRPGTPLDPTMDYSAADFLTLPKSSSTVRGCWWLDNSGDLEYLRERVRELGIAIGLKNCVDKKEIQ